MRVNVNKFLIILSLVVLALPLISESTETQTTYDILQDQFAVDRAENEASAEKLSEVEVFSIEDSPVRDGYVLYQKFANNLPAVDQVKKAYSGETMIIQTTGMIVDCIVPNTTWEKIYSGATFSIRADRPICNMRYKGEIGYIGDYPHYSHPSDSWTATVDVSEKKGKFKFVVGRRTLKKDAIDGVDFKRTVAFKSFPNSLQRYIDYSGRSGTVLNFIYYELTDYGSRETFKREFSLDLSEGNLGGYKGVLFEVIEASNFEITYRIKRQFE
jgi:hypothetical protein